MDDNTTLDKVAIEISSKADGAVNGIDNLANSISNLSKSLSGIKKIERLSTALSGIKEAISNFANLDTSKVSDMVSSLSNLNNIKNNKNLSSVFEQLSKIPELSKKLDQAEVSKFTKKIKELSDALKPLANEMLKVSTAFSNLPDNVKKINSTLDSAKKNMKNTENSATSLSQALGKMGKYLSIGTLAVGIKRVGDTIGKFVNSSNEYIENMNLFAVSMGDAADKAQEFVDKFSSTLGVDPSGVMRYMGMFNSLIDGFGVGSEAAYTMSKNLTQLSYDMSSFLNIPMDQAMQKIKSGISGEIEPMRAVGIALDQASLQETAYALGIDKKVSAMTRAQKTELLYYQMMTKTTKMQGDMGRTLLQPANALRVLKQEFAQLGRAIGNIFLPILMSIVPYVKVVVQWLTVLAQTIANFLGFELPKMDYAKMASGVGAVSSGIGDIGGSAKNANKELDKMLGKFDDLNVIEFDKNKGSGSGSGDDIGDGGSLGIPLPEYDALSEVVNQNLEEVKKKLKEIIPLVLTIGAGFATWKIAKGLAEFFKLIQTIKFPNFSNTFALLGLAAFLEDLDDLRRYIKDLMNEGPNFENVSGIISSFAGSLGDAFVFLGNTKLGGALKIIQGVGEIVGAIKDISDNGPDFNNVTRIIKGISDVGFGISIMAGNWKLAGIMLAIRSLTNIIKELQENWDAIKQGDWSGVDKITLIINGVGLLAGLGIALGVLTKIKQIKGATKSVSALTTTTTSLNTGMGKLSPNLTSLAKNLAMGIVIIGEVAAAAILIVGAIWVLGLELQKVGEAWTPVIENGKNVAIALGLGTALLVTIGVLTAALGTLGGVPLITSLGLGIAILLELGIATTLFIAEIWAIGVGLNQIGIAWKPVLDNGETITKAIILGTALLVGIGVVTAALGAVTVASAGTLPAAIGLGTAMLILLADAVIKFTDKLIEIANKLSNELHPALKNLNSKLPTINKDLKSYVDFMKQFAEYTLQMTKYSAISGFAATVDTIIGFFTKDPIKKMAKDVNKTYTQTQDLNSKLIAANNELVTAIKLVSYYNNFLQQLDNLTGQTSNINLSNGMYLNMKQVGKNLVTGLVDGINSEYGKLQNALSNIFNNLLSGNNAYQRGREFGRQISNGMAYELRRYNFPTLKGNINTNGDTATLKFKAYASGGFPDYGEMFMMNENGPELLGTIGNRTAVANQDQIIEGIKQAAYLGMKQALNESESGNSKQPVVVNVGNRKVYEGFASYQNSQNNMYGTSEIRV